jgi:hypothetical protein
MLLDKLGNQIIPMSYTPGTGAVQVCYPGTGHVFTLPLSDVTHTSGPVAMARCIQQVKVSR